MFEEFEGFEMFEEFAMFEELASNPKLFQTRNPLNN
jgi:hypothetical protein